MEALNNEQHVSVTPIYNLVVNNHVFWFSFCCVNCKLLYDCTITSDPSPSKLYLLFVGDFLVNETEQEILTGIKKCILCSFSLCAYLDQAQSAQGS